MFRASCLAATTAVALAVLPLAEADAQTPRVLGTYRDWTAYTYQGQDGQVCYIASLPTSSEGDYTRRGDVFAIVTHRPGAGEFDVFNIDAGYTYAPDSEVVLSVDGSEVARLFTHNSTSWARDAETDARIVQSMVRGGRMVVVGTSNRGTRTTDTFSLLGFTAARNAINDHCGRTG